MIPILLVIGFLGAGKTTFINFLLNNHPERKISLILNEFGDVQLESMFVKQHTENIVELSNGCMCCVAKSDIPRVLAYILEHSPQTEYVVIEASGLSDPDPVREALQTPPVTNNFYLENIVCIVDAMNFAQMRSEHPIITSQILDADLVVLSKVKEVGKEKAIQTKQYLEQFTPDIRVLMYDEELPDEIFLTQHHVAHDTHLAHNHTHEQYSFYTFQTPKHLQIDPLLAYLHQLPSSILRIKGVVNGVTTAGELIKLRVQRVGSRMSVDPMEPTQELTESTILFIGTLLDGQNIQTQLNNYTVLTQG